MDEPGGPPDDDGAVPELREALREFYLRSLAEELELSSKEAEALQPKIEALLDAQRDAGKRRMLAGLDVLKASKLALNATGADKQAAADAVAAAAKQERDGIAAVSAARGKVLDSLTPRQAALFLAFEPRFEERVRRMAAPEGRGEPGPGGPPDGGPPGGDQGGAGPGPGRRPGQFRGQGPAGQPGRGAGRDALRDEMRRTAMLLFTHEVRLRLELSDADTLTLLPKLDTLFDARMNAERKRRDLQDSLQEAARSPDATDAELGKLVGEARRLEDDGPAKIAAARQAITSGLTPMQAARFLVLEHRAEREVRDMMRRARGGWQGLRGGAGGQGPRQGPGEGQRPPGGMGGPGGGMRRPGGMRGGGVPPQPPPR